MLRHMRCKHKEELGLEDEAALDVNTETPLEGAAQEDDVAGGSSELSQETAVSVVDSSQGETELETSGSAHTPSIIVDDLGICYKLLYIYYIFYT